MSEVLTMLVGFSLAALLVYVGYVAGRDAAERRAHYTIATLRRSIRLLQTGEFHQAGDRS